MCLWGTEKEVASISFTRLALALEKIYHQITERPWICMRGGDTSVHVLLETVEQVHALFMINSI